MTKFLNEHAPPHEMMGVRKQVSRCRPVDLQSNFGCFNFPFVVLASEPRASHDP